MKKNISKDMILKFLSKLEDYSCACNAVEYAPLGGVLKPMKIINWLKETGKYNDECSYHDGEPTDKSLKGYSFLDI